MVFVTIEVSSSKLLTGYDPYKEKLDGVDFSENFAKKTYEYYISHNEGEIKEFEDFYNEKKKDGFTNDELMEFLAQDIINGSKIKYNYLPDLVKKQLQRSRL